MKKNTLVVSFSLFLLFLGLTMGLNAQSSARINHIAFYVINLKTSTDFYKNIVGLDTIPEPFHDGHHTWFLIGPKSHLHIISGALQKTEHDKNTHLCFSVPSVTDFISVLKKNNISFESWTGEKETYTNRVDGVKQIYFQDPDGFWLEINDAKE
ncbi:MAG: VOC family protein [Bacteroidia bacterium]|nr:VOC family protein [Bacteroidia bacterium]